MIDVLKVNHKLSIILSTEKAKHKNEIIKQKVMLLSF